MNQASMFFTAIVMLAGAGWYVMASNPDMLAKPAAAEAKGDTPKKVRLVARGPGPIGAKVLPPEDAFAGK
jgi:hypothetical protein